MHMFRILPVLLACSLPASAASATATGSAGASACAANYTSEGGFFKGRTMRTWAVVPAPPAEAFRTLYAEIARQGYKVNSSDAAVGVISAEQSVGMSDGKTIPLTALVEDAAPGSKVTLTFSPPGGLTVDDAAVRGGLCEIMTATGS